MDETLNFESVAVKNSVVAIVGFIGSRAVAAVGTRVK
jgi:hypothetical protein